MRAIVMGRVDEEFGNVDGLTSLRVRQGSGQAKDLQDSQQGETTSRVHLERVAAGETPLKEGENQVF